MRAAQEIAGLSRAGRVNAAVQGAARIDRIYTTRDLRPLEADLARLTGARLSLVGNYHNPGALDRAEPRWPRLLARLESDAAIRRLESFAAADLALMDRLGVAV